MVRLPPYMMFLGATVVLMFVGSNVGYGDKLESNIYNSPREEIRNLIQKKKKNKEEARLMKERERLVPGYQSDSLTKKEANILRLGLEKAMKEAPAMETPEAAALTDLKARSSKIEKALADLKPTDEKMAVPDLIKQELEHLKPGTETMVDPTIGDVEPSDLESSTLTASAPTSKSLLSYFQYDKSIQLHATALLNLEVGASRGSITYPLYHGTIQGSSKPVFFVLSEASDHKFSQEFGIMQSRNLAEVNQAGIEDGAVLLNGRWQFVQDAGRVSHVDSTGTLQGAVPNPFYSPLKRFIWNGRKVTINAPFVKWGDGPGQQLIEDHGGCDSLIRGNPPMKDIRGPGPEGCEGDPETDPLARYRGGQALKIDIPARCKVEDASNPCGSVTMKLHRAIYRPSIYPYVTIFDASKAATAEQLGIPYAPKLAMGWSTNNAIASLVEFQNGVPSKEGGPERFQSGLTSYGSQTWSTYSPIAHLTWAFIDCDKNRKMDDEGVKCGPYSAKLTRSGRGYFPDGFVFREDLQGLIDYGAVFITEAPAGWNGKSIEGKPDLQGLLLVNAPSPVTIRPK